MIEFILLLAIPLGMVLASITKHEVEIYSKKQYFPLILIALASVGILTYSTNKPVSLTMFFTFLTTLTWSKA